MEADALSTQLGSDTPPILVDIGKPEQFEEAHIPGARPLEYSRIVRSSGKFGGLLPDQNHLADLLAELGAGAESPIVCYDRQGGTAASRLIWTLHAYNFFNCSLLNGGLDAWVAAALPVESGVAAAIPFPKQPVILVATRDCAMNTDELLLEIESGNSPAILDARTQAEYKGEDARSNRGGHVPGARWLEWSEALDLDNQMKLLPDAELEKLVEKAGFSRDDKIVAYCQTHQRSSLSYVMLKHLGFENVLGLEGAWSEWGNRDDTPVETS